MAANSKIEWCDHTFNPWLGCTRVSPACDHCYAESWARRTGRPHLWQGERQRTAPANWRQPLLWNRQAARDGTRPRVFCASLADVFDNQVPPAWREDLWRLISETLDLDWLLLTKRPQNIRKMLPTHWNYPWPNVWLGTTVENQAEADRRIPHLLNVPAAVRFLSCEPLLGPVALKPWLSRGDAGLAAIDPLAAALLRGAEAERSAWVRPAIDWIICGGESGPKARPMHPDWARALRDQCATAGVPFFFKQGGEWAVASRKNGYRGVADMAMNNAHWVHSDGAMTKPSARRDGHEVRDDVWAMWKAGKKAAGRLLDGRTHDEFPAERVLA